MFSFNVRPLKHNIKNKFVLDISKLDRSDVFSYNNKDVA